MFSSITFYGRDSLINSACHHHHSACLSTIPHQPTNCVSHQNILQKTLAAPDARMQTALPKKMTSFTYQTELYHKLQV